MTEREHITSCLTEMHAMNNSIAAATLYHIVTDVLERKPAMTMSDALSHLYFLSGFTRGMADAPENWTDNGHVSAARFDALYQDASHPSRMLAIIKADLLKMDAVSGEQFQVEQAQHYLRDISECARLLLAELDKEIKE